MIGIFFLLTLITVNSMHCSHKIFCDQRILTKVAQSNFYQDSKTFVDLILIVPVQQALQTFQNQSIEYFLKNCFTEPDHILQPVQLKDWKNYPQFLQTVTNEQLKKFAKDLNLRWKDLAKKVNLDSSVNCEKDCSTFLPQMNQRTIIIPGGRFRESYYWDTYWIIKGLIVCDMLETAETLVQNFIHMIESYGMIPNGFRQYFLNRSQPPFFALMIKQLVKAFVKRGNFEKANYLQERSFHSLLAEHQFFMKTHGVGHKLSSGKHITLNYYNADTITPRPQSFRQDLNCVKDEQENERQKILKGISSMAESGWDFSTRWLTNSSDLKSCMINSMIPSDLNTLVALSEEYLIELCQKFHKQELKLKLFTNLQEKKEYFSEIYNGKAFPDILMSTKKQRSNLYPSDLFPFLLFPTKKANASDFLSNVVNPATSTINSGQQWDSPNVWAPNNWILHEVVDSQKAFQVAQQWVSTTYCSWKKENLIYEKYRSDILGQRGQGGEYGVQVGFGWTNGLALYYLSIYGQKLVSPSC